MTKEEYLAVIARKEVLRSAKALKARANRKAHNRAKRKASYGAK